MSANAFHVSTSLFNEFETAAATTSENALQFLSCKFSYTVEEEIRICFLGQFSNPASYVGNFTSITTSDGIELSEKHAKGLVLYT